MKIKLSIVVPLKNGKDTLERFIKSIKNYKHPETSKLSQFLNEATWHKRLDGVLIALNNLK